ncbi:hypothetical protein CDCA_CDCA08G2401 [Cyanidium caldarium]|uniref:Cdc23 domain-containing protein n=1 Tax=Cyanidium caldarium TaxID=2771 RepID=A0AAV9IW36_CYACA|nr:hypothetical protein CDCA_CDCA08G2401 [Cyanidium caldarium]
MAPSLGRLVQAALESLQEVSVDQLEGDLVSVLEEHLSRGLVVGAKTLADLLAAVVGRRDGDSVVPGAVEPFADRAEQYKYLCGKTLFDAREYRRCAHALEGCTDRRSRFLRLYARYLHGEKRREEEQLELGSGHGSVSPQGTNAEIPELLSALRAIEGADGSATDDPYLLLMRAQLCRACGDINDAADCLAAALLMRPALWSAWAQLLEVGDDIGVVVQRFEAALAEGRFWMFGLFLAQYLADHGEMQLALTMYTALLRRFESSALLLSQLAQIHFNLRDFDTAAEALREVRAVDPFRLEGADLYSNILFVKEDRTELGALASHCVSVDKYRAETCCVIGNYYALRQQHEKAAQYFRRALTLDRSYLSGWTLMGHEFLEMKNTAAAVEAYRRAIDLDPQDCRPFYGLGQAYELLGMPHYALYYYKKAATLRPTDSRMWHAVAQILYELEQKREALLCFERALSCDAPDQKTLRRVADIAWELGDAERAVPLYEQIVERQVRANMAFDPLGEGDVDCVLRLAAHYFQRGEFGRAEEYASLPMEPKDERRRELLHQLKRGIADAKRARTGGPHSVRHAETLIRP